MQGLVYEGPKEMHIRELDEPQAEKEEVLIRIRYSGICGSELSGFLGQNSLRQPPLIFGHEFSGTIVEIGESVPTKHCQVGQRVTANPLLTCGKCSKCLNGHQQLCSNRQLLSTSLPGSNTELVKIHYANVFPLKDSTPFEQATLTEPMACATRIAELADVKPTDCILLMGIGPIGLLTVKVLKLYGFEKVIAVDRNVNRLQMAEKEGAVPIIAGKDDVRERVSTLTNGKGVQVAIDAVGASVTRSQCIQFTASGGRVVFSGLHEFDSTIPINDMIRREITSYGAFAYSSNHFITALNWIEQGRLSLDEGIVKAPLSEGSQWFSKLIDNPGNVSKVLLCP